MPSERKSTFDKLAEATGFAGMTVTPKSPEELTNNEKIFLEAIESGKQVVVTRVEEEMGYIDGTTGEASGFQRPQNTQPRIEINGDDLTDAFAMNMNEAFLDTAETLEGVKNIAESIGIPEDAVNDFIEVPEGFDEIEKQTCIKNLGQSKSCDPFSCEKYYCKLNTQAVAISQEKLCWKGNTSEDYCVPQYCTDISCPQNNPEEAEIAAEQKLDPQSQEELATDMSNNVIIPESEDFNFYLGELGKLLREGQKIQFANNILKDLVLVETTKQKEKLREIQLKKSKDEPGVSKDPNRYYVKEKSVVPVPDRRQWYAYFQKTSEFFSEVIKKCSGLIQSPVTEALTELIKLAKIMQVDTEEVIETIGETKNENPEPTRAQYAAYFLERSSILRNTGLSPQSFNYELDRLIKKNLDERYQNSASSAIAWKKYVAETDAEAYLNALPNNKKNNGTWQLEFEDNGSVKVNPAQEKKPIQAVQEGVAASPFAPVFPKTKTKPKPDSVPLCLQKPKRKVRF